MRLIFLTSTLLFGLGLGIQVILERALVDFHNDTYCNFMEIKIRKPSRRHDYMATLEFQALDNFGNNITISFTLLEYLSSGYQALPISFSMKLCDFLYKEQYLGQMIAKQLPAGWSCPFKSGRHNFANISVSMTNFPYKLPFTWASFNIRTRADFDGFLTDTKIRVFSFKSYQTITQKPNKKS